MWGRSAAVAAVGAVVAAVLGVPVTSASAVRHLGQFNSPDRTIWCGDRSEAEANGAYAATGCFATLSPFALSFPEPATVAETKLSSEYAGWFSTSGKVETCFAAPPFNASHHCILSFVTSAPVLAFGETAEIEGLRCASASDGVTCTKVAGAGAGKGFRINAHEVVRVGPASSGSSPAPTFNRTAVGRTVSGSVLVKLPGSSTFVALTTADQIPFGTVINATHGRVRVTTAGPHGGTQTGEFFEGEFILTQGSNGLAVATLTGGNFAVCPTARERSHVARASSSHTSGKHAVRKLWTDAHGSFSTKGNYAAATVRGTEWLTEDLCEGTLILVTRDRVLVTNLVSHSHVTVKAGHRYLAKAP